MASSLTPQQSPQGSSSTFWQLISGVAHDLDLMLQDLFPDASLLPDTDQYGYPTHFSPDDPFVCHAALFEQFMRGTADDGNRADPQSESSGEYRTSQSVTAGGGASTSEVSDGRTTPSAASLSPPSPPPRTTPLSIYSSQLQSGGGASEETGAETTTSVSSIQETSEEGSSRTSSSFAPCDIGLLERLIRTHPIWFLPGIGRAGAVHLLQGKEVGTFIVRQSSKPNTMALSVRLPENRGPYVEHYLIETVGEGKLRLEGSDNHFHAIPMLVVHYCQCCDELPVQLTLPSPLAQAMSRQELSSLALLGQDFWLSSLVQSPTVSFAGPTSAFLPVSSSHLPPAHSSFKPPQGRSPTSSFANSVTNSAQQQQSLVSTVPGPAPPIPQAPKPPPRNVPPPPPPPPRSFIPMRSSSSASIGNTAGIPMDLHPIGATHNGSSDSILQEEANRENECLDRSSPILALQHNQKSSNIENKSDTKIKPTVHYKQSDIIEARTPYYRSSLADKVSDYEDIWGTPIPGDREKKGDFANFRSSFSDVNSSSHLVNRPRKDNLAVKLLQKRLQQMVNEETQTDLDESGSNTQYSSDKSDCSEPCHVNELKFTEEKSWTAEETSDFPLETQFSSPFYAEPIDCIKPQFDSNLSHDKILKEIAPAGRRLLNHRFSDPNIHWPPPSSSLSQRKDSLNTPLCPEENGMSLSSSLENLKVLRASPLHRRHQSLSVSAHWLQHSQIGGSVDECLKRDVETQVSPNDIEVNLNDDRDIPMPSTSKSKDKREHDSTWAVDSSWEWLVNEDSSDEEHFPLDSRFPVDVKKKSDDNQSSDATTVEELISPDLRVPHTRLLTQSNLMRVSEYDNLGSKMETPPIMHQPRVSDVMDDTATEFSEPWDSLRWERLLRLVISETEIIDEDNSFREQRENCKNVFSERNGKSERREDDSAVMAFEESENTSVISGISGSVDDTSISEYPTMAVDKERSKSFQERLEPLLDARRVVALRNKNSRVGDNIRQYIFRLSEERNNTFAMAIENFIQCTKESPETNPIIVMRNIRQFMSGMKNYLVKHGEGQFEQFVQEERNKLRPNEFLNIDAITEGALHKLVIKPLKNFIYQLFVNEYTRNGSLKLLSDNMKYARMKTAEEIGIRPDFKPPEGASLEDVRHFLTRLQQAYSPLKKLENLLAAISTIYNSVQQENDDKDHTSLGADDFLPIFIYVLVQCGVIAAEIEADYMWGLLHPSLLSGEGGYYLTTLSSAVHVLKSFQTCSHENTQNQPPAFMSATQICDKSPKQSPLESRKPSIADLQGFMKIVIPNELTGSIISKKLPVRPNMTTKEVCKMIAHKFNVTNPQDYGLFKLVKGDETQLGDNECPQNIREELSTSGIECAFAFKRCDAKFVWPLLECS